MRDQFCSGWAEEIHGPNGRGHFAKCHRSKRARWLTRLLLKAPTGTGATVTSWSHQLLSMQMTTSIAALPRHRNLQQVHAVQRHRNRKYKCRINCVAFSSLLYCALRWKTAKRCGCCMQTAESPSFDWSGGDSSARLRQTEASFSARLAGSQGLKPWKGMCQTWLKRQLAKYARSCLDAKLKC